LGRVLLGLLAPLQLLQAQPRGPQQLGLGQDANHRVEEKAGQLAYVLLGPPARVSFAIGRPKFEVDSTI
jgi:hypothetical protein